MNVHGRDVRVDANREALITGTLFFLLLNISLLTFQRKMAAIVHADRLALLPGSSFSLSLVVLRCVIIYLFIYRTVCV